MAAVQPFRIDPSATSSFRMVSDELSELEALHPIEGSIKAVVIGGGTGAPMSIQTLLSMGVETSAVVAMADDGGSTGILREEANVTPPGDIRKCIAAFARNPQDPLVRAFRYRFAAARDHALGNLLLAALEDACGSFPEAIQICERILQAQGHVYPSTLDHVTLTAKTCDGRILDSQAMACHSRTALESVMLHGPKEGPVQAYAPAVEAILDADLIVLGPGSLFTSIIPNLLVPGILDAIRNSQGSVVFVCSLADNQGETWGLTAKEHVQALFNHGMEGLLDYVLIHTQEPLRAESPATDRFNAVASFNVNDRLMPIEDELLQSSSLRPVTITYQDMLAIQSCGPVVIARDLLDPERPTWHSPVALSEAFKQVIKLSRKRRG